MQGQRKDLLEQAHRSQEDLEALRSNARRALYTDVEDLLFTGFLSHKVRIADCDLSLRSLSPGDTFLLRHRVGSRGSERNWKVWMVAASIWMVDGMNLLPYPHAVNSVYSTVASLPTPTLNILFSLTMGLFTRMGNALRRTESYCYEPYSRANWRLAGRRVPSHTSFNGIPGGENLGANHIQRMWVAFNLAEDDRLQHIQEWQSAKLGASANNPKGVKKLNAADDRLRTQEEDRRHRVIMRMLFDLIYGEGVEEEAGEMAVLVQGQPVVVPRVKWATTPDELAEQFRAWVAGDKDWHDIVVDTYKERIRDRFDHEKKERDDQLSEVMQEPGVTGGSSLVGYTLDQIRELRPDLLGPRQGTRRIFDSAAPAALYQKYMAGEAGAGRLQADEAGVYVQPPGEDDGPQDLQGQVERRRPQFSTEPIGPGGVRAPRDGSED